MEAIVLAGGFGTRLRHIVSDVPKPMAPVCGKPFLRYILDDLAGKGVSRVILAVGYKKECIEDYFGGSYAGMELVYSPEDTPLLTGGAIKRAMGLCREESVFVINGDTFFDVDLSAMARAHASTGARLTIATKHLRSFDRYGAVETDETGRILAFREKCFRAEGDINGGVYLTEKADILAIPEETFSFENDFMERRVGEGIMYAFPSAGYFIDIGIPEDYARAQEDFSHA